MTLGPPRPYPDELALSVVARHLRRWGYMRGEEIAHGIYGLGFRLASPTSTAGLEGFSRVHTTVAATDAKLRFIQRHTLLPYYLAFEPPARRRQILKALVSGSPLEEVYPLTALTRAEPKQLRFCPRCLIGDSRTRGESYWRRGHQLPGVDQCAIHRCPLHESDIPSRGIPWSKLIAPSLTLRHGDYPAVDAQLGDISTAVRGASWSALQHPSRSSYVSVAAYRKVLRWLSLGVGKNRISATAVLRDFGGWADAIGLEWRSHGPAQDVRAIFTNVAGPASPLQHILFRQYLKVRACKPEMATIWL